MSNNTLHRAKREKNDEFYTRLADIERECFHYRQHFRGRTIFLNCDDPEHSEFWRYFDLNFEFFGLKKVIVTHYDRQKPTYKLETELVNGRKKTVRTPLKQNGDFRSPECVELLKEADVVVTNPPFSLFREFLAQLVEHRKKFLIIGNNNAITYKEVFSLIMSNKVWLGHNNNKTFEFRLDPTYGRWDRIDDEGNKWGNVPAISWFTNLPHKKRNEELLLYRYYDPALYPRYDNYDAIEVSRVKDIPQDYTGVMGVPITFLDKHNPTQFQIVGGVNGGSKKADITGNVFSDGTKGYLTSIKGKALYDRIMIRNLNPQPKKEAYQ